MCNVNQQLIDAVWEKGRKDDQYDEAQVRKDACGAWIIKNHYGDRNSIFGWEIDHIFPQSILRDRKVPEDEINAIDNLRPLNWRNNDSKGQDYPVYHGKITSKDDSNVLGDYEYEVGRDDQEHVQQMFAKYLK